MMRRFEIEFSGRTRGALGVFCNYTETVPANNLDAAIIKLYDKYDHVHLLHAPREIAAEYVNPWYDPKEPTSRRAFSADVTPAEYRGFLIYHRIDGAGPIEEGAHIFDVVRGGVCVAQHAGPNGAQARIDALLGDEISANDARLLAWSIGATEWRTTPNAAHARRLPPPLVYFTAGLREVGYWSEVGRRLYICPRDWSEAVAAGTAAYSINKRVPF